MLEAHADMIGSIRPAALLAKRRRGAYVQSDTRSRPPRLAR